MVPLHEGVVYGPVRSRRLGHSLGINLLPRGRKVCRFNCTYCQYGWTADAARGATSSADVWPSPAAIGRAVAQALKRAAAQGEQVHRLTLAGHGEPTLHPQFAEIVDHLREVRDHLAPGVPLVALSNSSTVSQPAIRAALAALDERDPALLRRLNASPVPLEDIVKGLAQLADVVIQTMFVRDRLSRLDNASDLAVVNWLNMLAAIRPRQVHIYTLDRAPAWPYLQPVPAVRLIEITRRAHVAGFDAQVFAGNGAPHK
jgi:wyosine [tRNA(Phe)-imidazoG37] synthetase (radical SAM superfamily)